MAAKIVRTGEAASAALARGVDVAADIVGTTIGPAGRTVLIGREHVSPLLVRQGYAIMQQLDLDDPGEQMGVQAMRELAWRTSDQVGDGTSSAIVMARALLRAGMAAVAAGVAPADLQDGLDAHCRAVVAELEARADTAPSPEQLEAVAAQAASGDRVIGRLLVEAHTEVGPSGVVQVLEGHGSRDEVQVDPGLHFDQGWISPYFVDDQPTQSVEIDKPLVILHLGAVNDLGPIVPVLEMIAKADRGLVLIAENVGGDALSTLVVNKQRAGFKVAAVKAPGAGRWRELMLEDLAIATGGVVIGGPLGTSLEQLRPSMAGRAQKVRITRTGTTMVGGGGDPALVARRTDEIRDAIRREKHLSFDRDQHRKRLARLEAAVATVRIGGATTTAIAERHARALAASAAVRAAMAEGIVPGGSSSLVHMGLLLRSRLPGDLAGQMIHRTMSACLQAPLQAIAANGGLDGRSVCHHLEAAGDRSCFDMTARTLVAADAIGDPLPVLRAALINSVSTASRLLGLGAAITSTAA
ncbi:MAG TPA: chaperonin GroEL [Geminicoccus sp.]|uniref:chaperonin GroEL n=1 Tax=Geminicoccus sp. TaxID=2024832 RepID=UPI002E34CE1A|nr:chaperonin GroEL [Geminicoccus sp.]HEX2528235.1 chaperonin GroEL [Geminicoccus sp.]